MSHLVDTLLFQIKALKIASPITEHKFHDTRKWRFDICWPDIMFACEVEGGTWVNGAHSRGKHFESDCEKYEAAMMNGWTVYRVTGDMVKQGRAVKTIGMMVNKLQERLINESNNLSNTQ